MHSHVRTQPVDRSRHVLAPGRPLAIGREAIVHHRPHHVVRRRPAPDMGVVGMVRGTLFAADEPAAVDEQQYRRGGIGVRQVQVEHLPRVIAVRRIRDRHGSRRGVCILFGAEQVVDGRQHFGPEYPAHCRDRAPCAVVRRTRHRLFPHPLRQNRASSCRPTWRNDCGP